MADPHIAEAAANGWGSFASKATAAGVWSALIALVGYFIRSRVPMRKLKMEADESLRKDLLEQLEKVERTADEKHARIERQLEAERSARAQERAEHDAQMSVMRHELNNFRANFEALLLLIEAAPDKAAEHVVKIREAMAKREQQIAAEKSAIHAARIANAAPSIDP